MLILFFAGTIIGFVIGLSMGANGANVSTIKVTVWVLESVWTWLYYALMESSSLRGTLGKRACGLYVFDYSGRQVSFGRATGRYFGKIISSILLCIGFLMISWTKRKQGMHDLMAGCIVVKSVDAISQAGSEIAPPNIRIIG